MRRGCVRTALRNERFAVFHSFFYTRNKNKAIGAAAAAVFFLLAAGAGAATRTWTGGTSTDWNNTANWSGSIMPAEGEDVEVNTVTTNKYPSITADVSVNKITIKGMATVTLQSGTLTLTELDCQSSGRYLGNGSSNNGTGTTKFTGTAKFKTSNNSTSFGKLEIASGATLTVDTTSSNVEFNVTKDCKNEGTLALMGSNAATVNFSGNVDFSNGSLTGNKWKAVFKGMTAQTCTLKTGTDYSFESLECTNMMGLTVNDTTGTLKPTTLKLSSGGKAEFNCPVEAGKVECPSGAGNLTFQKTLKVTDKFEDLSGSTVTVKDTATIKELKHSGVGSLTFEKPLIVSATFEDSSSTGATIKDTANIKTVKHKGAGALTFQKTLMGTEEFDNTSATGAETVMGEATIKKLSHKGNCSLTFQKKATVQTAFTSAAGSTGALSFNGGADFQFTTEAYFQSSSKLTLKGECKFAGDFKRTGGETDLGKDSTTSPAVNGTLTTAAANKNITFSGTGAKLIAVDAGCSVKAGSGACTFADKVTATGSNDLTVETTGTATFEKGVGTDSNITLKCAHTEIKGDNTFMTLNIDNSGIAAATDVKFEGGKTQTIKNTFAPPSTPCFKGKDDTNRLTIDSTDGTKCKIRFTNRPVEGCFKYVTVKNAEAVDGSGMALNLYQSVENVKDGNFSMPTTKDWFSYKFTWKGGHAPTPWLWTDKENWICDVSTDHHPMEAPPYTGSVCDITIDTESSDPNHNLDLKDGVGTSMVTALELKSLTVNAGKRIGLGKCTIEATGSITNNGTIALYGNQTAPVLKSTAAPPNQITHGANSTIEYYGNDANAKDVLSVNNGGTPSNNTYKNLVVKMTGGKMTFDHSINATMLDASDNADSAQIELNCSTVTTTGEQKYKGKVELKQDVTLTTTSSGDITFSGTVDGTHSLTITAKGKIEFEKEIGSPTPLTPLTTLTATADDSYIVLKGTKYKTSGKQTFKAKKGVRLMSSANMEWEAGGTDGIKLDETTTDLYIECTTPTVQAALKSKLHCRNFYFSNGKLDLSAKITAEKDFAVWGTAYNAADPRYDDTSNTRFAFWTDKMPYPPPAATPTTPLAAGAYTPANHGASFGTFGSSAAIEIKGNFYINGADLEPSSTLTLTLPDNADSKPEFNKTNAVTEKQWGIPFAAAFNMEVKNVNATQWVAAATNGQGVQDMTGNTKWQFAVPKIEEAYTVYDDVVFVKFTKDLENSHGEIKANLEKAATAGTDKVKGGGVWYNGGMLYFDGKAYSDKECTMEISATMDLQMAAGFYLKTVNGAAWNTDATGTLAQSASATDTNDSTDRKGAHKNVTVDLSFLEGVFTAAEGHTMCKNYGVGMESSAAAPAYTGTTDKCAPVLVKVLTGQELHTDPDGNSNMATYAGAQKPYDAHNFIEFRYSEPVDIGTDMTIANKTMDAKQLNIQATSTLGQITNSSGLTVAGLASFASGSVNTGKAGAVDNTVHSLYRKFKPTPSGTDSFQSHRVRVAIAGYVDSVVTVDSKNYYKWQGYIDSATKPSGTVTRIVNTTIKDAANPQNTLDYQGTTQHALLPLSVNLTDTDLYGEWDTSPPMLSTFKPDRRAGTGFQNTEAVGWAPTGVSGLHRLEFHFFDNSTNPAEWYLRKGWVGTGENLYTNFSYGADVFGGARPFVDAPNTPNARRTAGGIRYSSIYNKNNSFTIHLRLPGVVSLPVSTTGMVKAGAESLVFKPYASVSPSPNPHDKIDGLYASIELVNKTYAFSTVFTVVYDDSGFVTDLAGNRMKTTTTPVFTIDRTPPRFDLTVAAVKDEANTAGAFKELYVVFNKKLNLKTIPYGTALTSDSRLPDLHNVIGKIKDHLRFIDAASPWAEKGGLKVMNVREKFTSDKATGLILELNRPLTLEDIKTTLLQCWVSDTSIDPLTGIQNVYVSYIQDDEGNYMPHQTAHAISDFAVNVVQPVYAYDGRYLNSGAVELTDNFEESLAAYDWNEEQAKLGTLVTGQDIFLYAKFNDGSAAPALGKVRAYFDNVSALTAESVSENYNKKKSGVMDWRIWLPSMNFSQSVPEFPALTPHNNMIPKTSSLDIVPSSKSHNNVLIFELPYQGVSSMSNAGWTSGDQISFLFGLADGGGTPLMICRNPVLLGTSTPTVPNYDVSAKSPLFALRLKNPSDISSADLWSFKLQKQKSQRGGVTILNNVINASTGEKTTLQVDMPSAGRLDVIIMTLDGDIVQYLQRGQAESGTHYFTWDGTTKSGKSVARGLYFVRIFGSGIDETRKVMVVKE